MCKMPSNVAPHSVSSLLISYSIRLLFRASLTHVSFCHSFGQDEVSMGTTILAYRYKDGVIVAADTRTSVSGYVNNRFAAKVTFESRYIFQIALN